MTTPKSTETIGDIRQDPTIAGIMGRVPKGVAATFSDEQLINLKAALGAQRGHRHSFDVRGTLGVGRWRWYYVFLSGRDGRGARRREARYNRLAVVLFGTLFLLLGLLLGVALLSLLQWGFGLDLVTYGRELGPGVVTESAGLDSRLGVGGL